jgi:hypothetical protein
MKFENGNVWGFEHAIRGMRNPLESWSKSDTTSDCFYADIKTCGVTIGQNDLELMQKLIKAGSEHRKFMRQIFVSVDITAPLYWWKEFDTYKVGTVANSTSTMHKLASTPITMDCFEMGDFEDTLLTMADYEDDDLTLKEIWDFLIKRLERLRFKYNETKDKRCWKELIRLIPESWLQTRTITMNYENILNMVHQRENHKLTEWSVTFIEWAKSLPYAKELLCISLERGEK